MQKQWEKPILEILDVNMTMAISSYGKDGKWIKTKNFKKPCLS